MSDPKPADASEDAECAHCGTIPGDLRGDHHLFSCSNYGDWDMERQPKTVKTVEAMELAERLKWLLRMIEGRKSQGMLLRPSECGHVGTSCERAIALLLAQSKRIAELKRALHRIKGAVCAVRAPCNDGPGSASSIARNALEKKP